MREEPRCAEGQEGPECLGGRADPLVSIGWALAIPISGRGWVHG